MSVVYWFIATRSTNASTVPLTAMSVSELTRRTRGALLANSQPMTAGQLFQFSTPKSRPNLVLCDGSELPKVSFQDLYDEIEDSEGLASDPANFKIPNFVGAATAAPTYPPQVVTESDVNTGTPPTIPPVTGTPGGVDNPNPPSGGRPPNRLFLDRLPD